MEPGQRFADRFQIEALIGEGGVGRVFRATDVSSGAYVAIKCLRKEYATKTIIRRRFMREARAIGRLSHPNIVEVYDYGEHDNTPFICMEFIDGTPMSELRDELIPVPRLFGLVDQLLASLAYTHARGIIHRDVKPENVIIVAPAAAGLHSMVKLVDFGFARVEDDQDIKMTQAKAQAFGTPQYMAPEQAMGGKGVVGPSTDLYAVGVLLYEFICGRPPFTGAHGMAVALKHLMEEVPPLEPRPGMTVPHGVEAIIRKVLQKEPHKRYRTAADMRRALAIYHQPGAEIATPAPARASDAAAHIAKVAVEAALQASGPAGPVHDTLPMDPSEHLARARADGQERDAPPVGRESDLMWLWQRVRVACDERAGRVVALGAEQGMGKSHLVQFLRDQVAEGGWMNCYGGDGAMASGEKGLRGVLEDVLEQPPLDSTAALEHVQAVLGRLADAAEMSLDPTVAQALAQYLRPPEDGLDEAEASGEVLFDRVCDVLELASRERPVLVLLESVDVADAGGDATLFAVHIARRLQTASFPILVVATYALYDGLASDAMQACLRGLESIGPPVVEGMSLSPLPAAEVAKMLRMMDPIAVDVAEAIAERTQGNPFFAREMLQLVKQNGDVVEVQDELVFSTHANPERWPRTLSESLLQRSRGTVERLPDGQFAGELLEHAAVLGANFDYGLLVDFLERIFGDGPRLERCLESLLHAQLLEESSSMYVDRLHFTHSILRVALKDSLAERVDLTGLHRKAGQAMVAYHAGSAPRFADVIAGHFAAGGLPADAARYYMMAGRYARDEARHADAMAYFEASDRILSRIPGADARSQRATLWIDLGELELDQGNETRAHNLAARVHKWARKSGNANHEGRSLLLISDLFRRQGRLPEAAKGYDRAATAFQRSRSAKGLARARLGQAMTERSQGRYGEAKALFEQARQAMEAVGDKLGTGRAWQGMGETSLRLGDYESAQQTLDQARRAYAEAGFSRDAAYCAWMLAETHSRLGDFDRAVEAFDAARRDYASIGDRRGLARCERGLARLFSDQHDLRRALAHYRSAATVFAAVGDRDRAANTFEELGQVALALGDQREAETAFRRVLSLFDGPSDPTREAVVRASLALAAAQRGDHSAADAELAQVLALDGSAIADEELARLFEGIAEAEAEGGRRGRGPQLLDRAAAIFLGLGQSQASARVRARRAELWGGA